MDTPDQFESSPASSADEILARFERELDESPPADRKELLARREQLLWAHPELADVLAQYLRDVDAMNNALAESTLPEERTSDDPPQFSPGDRVGYKGDYEIRAARPRGHGRGLQSPATLSRADRGAQADPPRPPPPPDLPRAFPA